MIWLGRKPRAYLGDRFLPAGATIGVRHHVKSLGASSMHRLCQTDQLNSHQSRGMRAHSPEVREPLGS
jgi:hypothetical protein